MFKSTKYILSIDGGGIRGILPAKLLVEIEKRSQKPIAQLFDMVAGTSTGGILACGLSATQNKNEPLKTSDDLLNIYVQNGAQIFSRTFSQKVRSGWGLWGEKYSAQNLEEILKAEFADKKLSESSIPTLITAYEISRSRTNQQKSSTPDPRGNYFFKSWKAQKTSSRDFKIWQICRGTSAAPTYFKPAKVYSQNNEEHFFVDGGVFANNPALCAYISAKKYFGPEAFIQVVSLGTGDLDRPISYQKAVKWGPVGWIKPLINILMDGSEDAVDYHLKSLIPEHYHRMQFNLGPFKDNSKGPNHDLDDASNENIEKLLRRADEYILSNNKKIDDLISILLFNSSKEKQGHPLKKVI